MVVLHGVGLLATGPYSGNLRQATRLTNGDQIRSGADLNLAAIMQFAGLGRIGCDQAHGCR